MKDIGIKIYRAYYRASYCATKAILTPVVAASAGVISQTLSDAVKQGIQEALPKPDLSNVFAGLDSFLRK
jgi:hypothetical protein